MANPRKINLGVFAAGEIPFDFVHTFTDTTGAAIDLTAYTTIFVNIEGPEEAGGYGAGNITFDGDKTTGRVTYEWAAADFVDVGKYKMLIWVSDGQYRIASDLVIYEVYDGPGPTPS